MTSTSRKTRALLAGTAAVGTAFALAVPLIGTAHAAHVASLDLSPTTSSGAAGTCLPYTITLTPTAGSSVAAQPVDVVLTESADATPPVIDADFCTAPTGATTPVGPDAGTNSADGNPGTTDRAEFTTDANGVVTFGVTSNSPSTVTILAFYEPAETRDNIAQPAEFQDSSTATFGAGAVDDVDTVNSPPTASGYVGEPLSIDVTVRNAAAQTVAGITPSADVETGPSALVTPTCTVSNNVGVSTCTYTPAGVGTDSVRFWVNQSGDPSGANFNPLTEPSAVTSATIAAAVTGYQVDLTCSAPAATDTSAEDCVNYTNDPTQVFTATVTGVDGADVGTDRDPVNGVLVRFTENGAGTTLSAPSCTTAGAGTCSVTLNHGGTPTSGEVITVTASVAGQNPAGDPGDGEISSDSGTLTFIAVATAARIVTLTPSTSTTAPGGVATFTATVTDASGQPVRGVTVTFSETGAGFFRTPTTVTTNSAGQATVESTSSTVETGSQTVTATIDSATTDCELAANVPTAGNPAGACTDSSTNTFASPTPSPSPTTAAPTVSPTTAAPTATSTVQPSCTGGAAVSSLASNVTQITAGNAPLLTGTVTNANGAPCRGVAVTIFKQSFGENSYTAVATVSTDNNGQFTLVVRPLVQTSYGANTANNAVRSNIVNIRVYTRVNINTPATTAVGGTPVNNPVTFSGNLFPGYGNIAVGLGTLVNGRFAVLQQTRSSASGTYSLTRTLPRGTGVYIIFVSAVSQGSDKGSKSITLTVS